MNTSRLGKVIQLCERLSLLNDEGLMKCLSMIIFELDLKCALTEEQLTNNLKGLIIKLLIQNQFKLETRLCRRIVHFIQYIPSNYRSNHVIASKGNMIPIDDGQKCEQWSDSVDNATRGAYNCAFNGFDFLFNQHNNDLFYHISSFLSVKSLLKFTLSCRECFFMIENESFWNYYRHNHTLKLNFQQMEIIYRNKCQLFCYNNKNCITLEIHTVIEHDKEEKKCEMNNNNNNNNSSKNNENNENVTDNNERIDLSSMNSDINIIDISNVVIPPSKLTIAQNANTPPRAFNIVEIGKSNGNVNKHDRLWPPQEFKSCSYSHNARSKSKRKACIFCRWVNRILCDSNRKEHSYNRWLPELFGSIQYLYVANEWKCFFEHLPLEWLLLPTNINKYNGVNKHKKINNKKCNYNNCRKRIWCIASLFLTDLEFNPFNIFCQRYDKFYNRIKNKHSKMLNKFRAIESVWHSYWFSNLGERLEKLHGNYREVFIKLNESTTASTLYQIENIDTFFKVFHTNIISIQMHTRRLRDNRSILNYFFREPQVALKDLIIPQNEQSIEQSMVDFCIKLGKQKKVTSNDSSDSNNSSNNKNKSNKNKNNSNNINNNNNKLKLPLWWKYAPKLPGIRSLELFDANNEHIIAFSYRAKSAMQLNEDIGRMPSFSPLIVDNIWDMGYGNDNNHNNDNNNNNENDNINYGEEKNENETRDGKYYTNENAYPVYSTFYRFFQEKNKKLLFLFNWKNTIESVSWDVELYASEFLVTPFSNNENNENNENNRKTNTNNKNGNTNHQIKSIGDDKSEDKLENVNLNNNVCSNQDVTRQAQVDIKNEKEEENGRNDVNEEEERMDANESNSNDSIRLSDDLGSLPQFELTHLPNTLQDILVTPPTEERDESFDGGTNDDDDDDDDDDDEDNDEFAVDKQRHLINQQLYQQSNYLIDYSYLLKSIQFMFENFQQLRRLVFKIDLFHLNDLNFSQNVLKRFYNQIIEYILEYNVLKQTQFNLTELFIVYRMAPSKSVRKGRLIDKVEYKEACVFNTSLQSKKEISVMIDEHLQVLKQWIDKGFASKQQSKFEQRFTFDYRL